ARDRPRLHQRLRTDHREGVRSAGSEGARAGADPAKSEEVFLSSGMSFDTLARASALRTRADWGRHSPSCLTLSAPARRAGVSKGAPWSTTPTSPRRAATA